MLSVEEARVRVLARLKPLPAEIVSLQAAWGRIAAAPVLARLDNPPADISAMDGYAVRGADTPIGARLRLQGEAAAGHPFEGRLEPGCCVRVFTGSVMPEGSDGVLIQENASKAGDMVNVLFPVEAGKHVRRRGQDFSCDDIVIEAGRRLGARDIGIAAAANHTWLQVHRRPRIALLSTGDELVLPGELVPEGGIVNSNAPMLAALIRAAGGEPVILPPVRDDVAAIARMVDGLAGTDMLVTIGGASVGDYDLVQNALTRRGLTLDFWKIAMRPGKPLMHGQLELGGLALPVLGLPGNPVSALVCSLLFLLPALARLSGAATELVQTEQAVLGADVAENDHRHDHLRATLATRADGTALVHPVPVQDSGMLRRLAGSDALILRPPHAPPALAGDAVTIIRLDRCGL